MTDKEQIMDKLYGALAGLFLVYGISTEEGSGKIIIELLKEAEKQLARKISECEELKKKERKLYKFLKEPCNWGHNDVWIRNYLLHYLFKEREHTACTADILKDKLKIATEALEKIANQNFNTPNRICNLAEKELVPCTNSCKHCLQAYAQLALEKIESEEQ